MYGLGLQEVQDEPRTYERVRLIWMHDNAVETDLPCEFVLQWLLAGDLRDVSCMNLSTSLIALEYVLQHKSGCGQSSIAIVQVPASYSLHFR